MYKLEKELGLGNGTIGKWGKNGRIPNYANLLAVATALGVTVGDLTGSLTSSDEDKEAPSLPAEGNEKRAWAKQVIDRMDAADFEPIAALLKHYADKYKTP